MNGKVSCIYPWMYFSVSKMLYCLERGGGLFSCCRFSLFVCWSVCYGIFYLFIMFNSSCAFITPFWEPWRSSVILLCLWAQITGVTVFLITVFLILCNDASKQNLYKKGSFNNCLLFKNNFQPFFKKNPPFFTTVCQISVMPELNTNFCIYLHYSFIGWISEFFAFLSTGQNCSYFFVELPWCRLKLIYLSFLFFLTFF